MLEPQPRMHLLVVSYNVKLPTTELCADISCHQHWTLSR